MLVDPLPSVDRDRLLTEIRQIASDLTNLNSLGGDGRYYGYIEWANLAAQKLALLVRADDVDRLVLTRRYWTLQSVSFGNAAMALVDTEQRERARAFEETERDLKAQIDRWSRPGVFVAPDTSFYIRHTAKLEDVELAQLLDVWPDERIHVLVPIVVVDELDRLKQSGERHVRWRAGHTLGVLDERLRDPTQQGRLRAQDSSRLDNDGSRWDR